MKYIIMAAGKGTRWGDYKGVPKHLIEINGEALLGRTTRLLKENKIYNYVITSDDVRYKQYGMTISQTYNDCEIDRFEETTDDEICYLYGDVYYTEEAIKSIIETPADDVLFFGSSWEIIAVKVSNKKLFFEHKNRVKELFLKGQISRCIGWEVYRSINNIPLTEHKINERYCIINDGSDDIDFPDDYENFINRVKEIDKDKKMSILVCSCDMNEDIFEAFHHCMEKYYPEHPEIIYTTENIQNPYYKTISKNYPLNMWTKRIRETLQEIDSEAILLMIDDCFIHSKVDIDRIDYARKHLKGNIALFNFEKAFDNTDIQTNLKGFKKRRQGSPYELSLMCGIWDKERLIDILDKDSDPWTVEINQNTKGYSYYINSEDYIIDWGYETYKPCGLFKGKWTRNIVDFFEKEGIEIDYDKRGFID